MSKVAIRKWLPLTCTAPVNCLATKGQAVVEFTLIFILLLIIAWIPVDFGLALYTSHIAQNASREGARIAAADPNVGTQTGNCASLAICYAMSSDSVLHRTALRLSRVLMPNTTVTLEVVPGAAGACNDQVRMRVQGTYNFFFYRLLNWFGYGGETGRPILRETFMRWEHQCV